MNILIKYFWIFFSGCFLGSILETGWCLLKERKLKKRKDLIYGYFTSMYGIAGTIILMITNLFAIRSGLLVFIISLIVSGLVEYFTSFIQEKSMGVLFWDYSKMKFNLHGRINLVYLLGFGGFGVLWWKIYPSILKVVEDIIFNKYVLVVGSVFLFLFMIYNFIISFIVGVRQKERREGVVAKNRLEIWIDNKYSDKRMAKVFPNLIHVSNKEV